MRNEPLPTICILAGGLGTRLGDKVATTPKPLLKVAGQPFVLHQLRLLAEHGASEAVLCVGYLGEIIERRVGTEQFGIRLRYSYDAPGLSGTLGAIRRASALLPERFLVLYGDTYLRLDYRDAARHWVDSRLDGLMTVLRNRGQWGSSNAHYDDGRVVAHDKSQSSTVFDWIDYGLGGLRQEALARVPEEEVDLSTLYSALAQSGDLCGYAVTDRFYGIGSPAGFTDTEAYLRSVTQV